MIYRELSLIIAYQFFLFNVWVSECEAVLCSLVAQKANCKLGRQSSMASMSRGAILPLCSARVRPHL